MTQTQLDSYNRKVEILRRSQAGERRRIIAKALGISLSYVSSVVLNGEVIAKKLLRKRMANAL